MDGINWWHKFLEKQIKCHIIDKKSTFTILIFLSLRNGLLVHRSEQRQFLEQIIERPLIIQNQIYTIMLEESKQVWILYTSYRTS
jgi:hypothetical protein